MQSGLVEHAPGDAPIAEGPPAPGGPPDPAPEGPPAPTTAEAPAPAPARRAWELVRPGFLGRHRRLLYAAAAAAAVVALAIIPYPLYITQPCTVRPLGRAEVRAQVDGIIAQVLVDEGDDVEVGAPLARLDDRDLVYELEQATADVERLRAALSKVSAGNRPEEIQRARALVQTREEDARYAQIEAARQQQLFEQDVASAARRDEAARSLALKRSELAQAQAELRLIEAGSRAEEIAIAEAELRRAQAEVAFVQKKLQLLTIRAPIAGRVLTPRLHERLHARLGAGDPFCELGSTGDKLVEIWTDEADADAIRAGQPVAVKVRTFPLEAFTGRVDLIAPAVTEEGGQRVLRVDARVADPGGRLQPRMTGYAEIDAGRQTLLGRLSRRAVRWIRVRFLL